MQEKVYSASFLRTMISLWGGTECENRRKKSLFLIEIVNKKNKRKLILRLDAAFYVSIKFSA